MTQNHNTQSGAVFYYILLAVALIAALTYFVARDNRASVGLLSDDQARIVATEILEQANLVTTAYQKLRLRGFHEESISFVNSKVSGYTNPNCTSEACEIFNLNGGALNWIVPPKNANNGEDWTYTGDLPIYGAGGSNERYDLTMILPNVKDEVCKMINFKIGRTSSFNSNIPINSDTTLTAHKFTGVISTGPNYIDGGRLSICTYLTETSGAAIPVDNANYFIHTIFAG